MFRDMLNRGVIVYFDNILVYSNSLEEHICQVRAVLQRLIQYQLYAKAEKCEFNQTVATFLGYVISQEAVVMDEKKVKAGLEWPLPRTVKELQRFLGFTNFYWRFIRDFSSFTAPLTTMTKHHATKLTRSSESQFRNLCIQELVHCSAHPPTSGSRTPIHCRGLNFKPCVWRFTFSLSRITSKVIYMCLLFSQINSSRTELQCGQLWTSGHEISTRLMGPLAGRSITPIYSSHQSQESLISRSNN